VISPETRMMGLPCGEEIMIVGLTVWTQSTSVTDGRTDGRTDRITITDTVQRIASHGKNLITTRRTTTGTTSVALGDPFPDLKGNNRNYILSPYLFTRYIRVLLCAVASSRYGRRVGNISANIFAYTDDIVLLAPSWHALQVLISTVERYRVTLDLSHL